MSYIFAKKTDEAASVGIWMLLIYISLKFIFKNKFELNYIFFHVFHIYLREGEGLKSYGTCAQSHSVNIQWNMFKQYISFFKVR